MDPNPCATRWRMKKLGRKKISTKVFHKNVKVKRHIIKFCIFVLSAFIPNNDKIYKILKKKDI